MDIRARARGGWRLEAGGWRGRGQTAATLTLILIAAAPAFGQEADTNAGGEDATAASAPVEPPPPETSDNAEADEGETAPTTAEEQEPEAGEGEGGEADDEEVPRSRQFGHRFQGGIGFVIGSGYFFEVAYGGNYCYMEDDPEASVCHGRTPVFFDFQASFGVTDGLEILLEYRLGLLEERRMSESGTPDDSRPMAFGLGVRYFIGATNRIKAFIGALLDIDFTEGLKTDVFLRPLFGMQVEIVRWVGFFIQASVNLSFVRSFGVALDAGGGFQFRFP